MTKKIKWSSPSCHERNRKLRKTAYLCACRRLAESHACHTILHTSAIRVFTYLFHHDSILPHAVSTKSLLHSCPAFSSRYYTYCSVCLRLRCHTMHFFHECVFVLRACVRACVRACAAWMCGWDGMGVWVTAGQALPGGEVQRWYLLAGSLSR